MSTNLTRLSRKKRSSDDLGILKEGGVFDVFDNSIKTAYRINDDEYNYIAENMKNEELDLLIRNPLTFSEKREILNKLQSYLKQFYNFDENINKLKAAGYNPIAVTEMFFEDTYVFETEEEAIKAFQQFEAETGRGTGKDRIVGWWYGKEEFLKAVAKYEEEIEKKLTIKWL